MMLGHSHPDSGGVDFRRPSKEIRGNRERHSRILTSGYRDMVVEEGEALRAYLDRARKAVLRCAPSLFGIDNSGRQLM